jgi:hypothetical protein
MRGGQRHLNAGVLHLVPMKDREGVLLIVVQQI